MPRPRIREAFAARINGIVEALSLSLDTLSAIKVATDAIVFFRDDGKPLYIFKPSLSASRYVSSSIPPESIATIAIWSRQLATDKSLDRVLRLFVSSLEKEGDQLRSFLAIWNALEIFINKIFSKYEQQLFLELKQNKPQLSWQQYLDRVKDVMKDKYRLADRFALLSYRLSPSDADDDFREFSKAKKLRDDLSHGQDINEAALPTMAIQSLLRKYIRLHLENQRKAAS